VSINGAFNRPDLSKTIPNLVLVDWGKAAIVLGISDLPGLSRAGDILVGDDALPFQAGAPAFATERVWRLAYDASRWRKPV
jgi:hypothetical protein